jgi:Zn-dependent peptidase ImmA (M78 family)
MNDELLMDLADCGSPEQLVSIILKHNPDWPRKVPVRDFARVVGIADFKELEADGFEGALMTDAGKTTGVILTKVGVREERTRFTISHELGHFLIPSHKGDQRCTSSDMSERRVDTEHREKESEANRFAASFLMPRPMFVRDLRELGDADVSHLRQLAEMYGTSLEATINRHADLTDDDCAWVFSKDGVIRYVRATKQFPKLRVTRDDVLPLASASNRTPATPLRVPSKWEEVNGTIWLEASMASDTPYVLEQCIRQANGYQVTLLLVEIPDEDEVEERAELEESWAVRFRN